MKAPFDIEKLTRTAIAAHLLTEMGEEERELIADLRDRCIKRGGTWDAWHDTESRRLYAEAQLGMDVQLKPPRRDQYPDPEWQSLCDEYDAAFPSPD